jgi:uncharacterized protein (TIGR02594 family)
MAYARSKIGIHEIAGDKDNPFIIECFKDAGLPENLWHDSTTAWCGCFVNKSLKETGFPGPKGPAAARSWAKTCPELLHLAAPVHGCIMVYSRPPNPSHGHVGFYDATDAEDDDCFYNTLGGNQNNKVMVKPYPKERFIGAYWPSVWPLPPGAALFA